MKSDSSLSNWAQETNNIWPVTIGGNVSVSYRQVVLCSTNGDKSQFFQASLNYLNRKKFLCLPIILSIIHCVFPASSQMRISLVTQYQFGTRIALICVLKQVGIPLEKNSKWPLILTEEVKRRLQRVPGWWIFITLMVPDCTHYNYSSRCFFPSKKPPSSFLSLQLQCHHTVFHQPFQWLLE